MIIGAVNTDLEASLFLSVLDASGQSHKVQTLVDSGFNGYLTLPPALIAALGLSWLYRQQGQLADGSIHPFDVYVASVEWDGKARNIEVESVDAQPLLGMALMQGSELRIQVLAGGSVNITALS